MTRLTTLAALVLVAAPVWAQDEDACGADNRQDLIGQHEDSLTDLPDGTRVMPPGTMRTMEWLPERLNIELDENGIVVAVDCG